MVQAAIGVINRRKTLLIITTKPDEVQKYITKTLHRGATVWNASGAFTHEDKTVLFVAMTPYQAAEVRDYTKKIDDMAFDSIISAVQSGKADVGVAGMTVTPDREKNVLFSDTYTSSSQVIIVRKK